jgi:hypothetical protein
MEVSMSRPKVIKVGPFKYRLLFTPTLPDVGGFTDLDQSIIAVSTAGSLEHQQETLLHELLHAVCDATALRNKSRDEQEELVSALSPGIFALLRENPGLVNFLTERGK